MASDASSPSDAPGCAGTVESAWTPHPGQWAVLGHDARFKVLAAGRRWGKTDLAANVAVRRGLSQPGATIWWVAPTYQQANDYGFARVLELLDPALLAGDPKRSTPRTIRLTTGATLSFRSADREDTLRGGGVDLLVIDESPAVAERAWTEELRPTLSDTLGDLLAIGTPKGRNWFWRWFERGQDAAHPDVASWQASTYQNPHVPDSEVDAARTDVPAHVFRQEYLAEFLADGSTVFPNLGAAIGDHTVPVDPARLAARGGFAIGVDFARQHNYTAIVVLAPDGRVVALERLTQTSWGHIQRRIEALAATYHPATVAVDATRDNKIVADLAASLRVRPVTFSATRKTTLVENLITRLESGGVTLPAAETTEADQLLRELRAYEFEMTARGNVHYGAPAGVHDDCVDALALAVDALRAEAGTQTRRRHAAGPHRTTRGIPRAIRSRPRNFAEDSI